MLPAKLAILPALVVAITGLHRKSKSHTGDRSHSLVAGFSFADYRMKKPTMTKLITAALISLSLLTLTACESSGPKYRNVRAYSEGLAPVQSPNGRWGYINEQQHWVIQPRFEDAQEFKGGRAAARQNGKWGFINKRGEWL